MAEGNKNISVHNGAANEVALLEIFLRVPDFDNIRHFKASPIIIWHPLESREKPFRRCGHMFKASLRLPNTSVLQSVRKGLPSRPLPGQPRLWQSWTQKGEVAEFLKMHLDSHKFVFKINVLIPAAIISLTSFPKDLCHLFAHFVK
jgi:hypothetical protein